MNFTVMTVVPLAAAAICALLIVLLRPPLQRCLLVPPNPRSSHTMPTPQGGGVAVIAATLLVTVFCVVDFGVPAEGLLLVTAATIALAVVGAIDDLKPIPVLPRLILQAAAIAIVVTTLPDQLRIMSTIPLWAERALLLIAGLWFINLVNFMDGIDWITTAEIVPITAALAVFGFFGQLGTGPSIVALALCGAMIGFAPFNKPVAKLFLGDVGSLPIGLLTGWCLLQLAAGGHVVAALLLPLYYLTDATVTLVRRMTKGETVWVAHRSHFYQQATGNGFTVMQIVGEIFILNLVLAALAAASVWITSPYVAGMTLAVGFGAVALVLNRFSRPREALP